MLASLLHVHDPFSRPLRVSECWHIVDVVDERYGVLDVLLVDDDSLTFLIAAERSSRERDGNASDLDAGIGRLDERRILDVSVSHGVCLSVDFILRSSRPTDLVGLPRPDPHQQRVAGFARVLEFARLDPLIVLVRVDVVLGECHREIEACDVFRVPDERTDRVYSVCELIHSSVSRISEPEETCTCECDLLLNLSEASHP